MWFWGCGLHYKAVSKYQKLFLLSLTAFGGVISPCFVQAQVRPDAGRILQETRPPEPVAPLLPPPIEAPARPRLAVPSGGADVHVQVTHFTFVGNSALNSETLAHALAGWSGKSLNFGQLIEAVEAVEARYKEAGYFLAQAYLPPQKIKDGAIEIAISEGILNEVRLEGENRVSADVLYAYLDRLPKDQALQLPILERQILLINEIAGSQASLDLQAGEKPGSTDVVLAQKPDDALNGKVDASNHGSPSTGIRRFGLVVSANSPFGLGERITGNVLTSDTRDLTSYNLRGEIPVGGDGWRLTAAASRAEYSLGSSFESLKASGAANSIRLGAAYPFIRSRNTNLKLQVEADEAKLKDQFLATSTFLDKRSHGLTGTLSGDQMDDHWGGGSTKVDIALRMGRLSLGTTSAAQDAPPTGAGTAGSFSKINLNALRQQTLTRELSLQVQISWQLSGNKNLDSSEKLSLGGPTTLPGYASGEASGDAGIHAKAGIRWQASPELALTAFTDYGRLHLANNPIQGVTKNTKRLTDQGISADWMFDRHYSVGAILALAGVEAPNPTDNAKPRLWLSFGYNF